VGAAEGDAPRGRMNPMHFDEPWGPRAFYVWGGPTLDEGEGPGVDEAKAKKPPAGNGRAHRPHKPADETPGRRVVFVRRDSNRRSNPVGRRPSGERAGVKHRGLADTNAPNGAKVGVGLICRGPGARMHEGPDRPPVHPGLGRKKKEKKGRAVSGGRLSFKGGFPVAGGTERPPGLWSSERSGR